MTKKLVVGNWKMNPTTTTRAKRLLSLLGKGARRAKRVETVICPPHVFQFLPFPASLHRGAQDLFYEKAGAHTGEISGEMLKAMNVRYVILGHSERRRRGETDDEVNRKVKRALMLGLVPVVCVGERRRDGESQYLHVVKEQLRGALAGISKRALRRVVIAYEPVWAIGRRAALPPEEAREMNLFIRKVFADVVGGPAAKKLTVLYGGSVDGRNAARFFSIGKMDGLLVGRESLDPPRFLEILRAANKA